MQTTHTAEQLRSLRARGANYLVICQYSVGVHEQGDLVSWHKTHDAAGNAALKLPNGYFAVRELSDELFDAEMQDR